MTFGMMALALRCLTTLMALPGMMYLAAAAGVFEFPPEMRFPEKMDFIGVPIGSALGKAILCCIGIGKVTIAINNWVLKSSVLDAVFALTSVPGFGLVLFVHRELPNPDPWSAELPVIIAPIALCTIWMLKAAGGKEKKQ